MLKKKDANNCISGIMVIIDKEPRIIASTGCVYMWLRILEPYLSVCSLSLRSNPDPLNLSLNSKKFSNWFFQLTISFADSPKPKTLTLIQPIHTYAQVNSFSPWKTLIFSMSDSNFKTLICGSKIRNPNWRSLNVSSAEYGRNKGRCVRRGARWLRRGWWEGPRLRSQSQWRIRQEVSFWSKDSCTIFC